MRNLNIWKLSFPFGGINTTEMTSTASNISKDTVTVTAVDVAHPATDSNATTEMTEDSVSVTQTTIYAVVGVVGPNLLFYLKH